MIAKTALFALAGVTLTCALWWTFKPVRTDAPASAPMASTGVVTEARASAPEPSNLAISTGERVFELALSKGRLISRPERLEVHEGDSVVLEIFSDTSDELHVHGYDLRARIKPDEAVKLRFMATRTGRFGLELHRAHAELGALEVYPR